MSYLPKQNTRIHIYMPLPQDDNNPVSIRIKMNITQENEYIYDEYITFQPLHFRNDDIINQKESDFCASVFSGSDRPHIKLSFLRHFSTDSEKKNKKTQAHWSTCIFPLRKGCCGSFSTKLLHVVHSQVFRQHRPLSSLFATNVGVVTGL